MPQKRREVRYPDSQSAPDAVRDESERVEDRQTACCRDGRAELTVPKMKQSKKISSQGGRGVPHGQRGGRPAKPRGGVQGEPEIPKRWVWHYEALSSLRERLLEERRERLTEAAEPMERHSLSPADSATDEFDHALAFSRLSVDQDALYEVEAAMKRILDGTYGICEESCKPIPAARLKALPWTRYRKEAANRLERAGVIPPAHLGHIGPGREEDED